MTGMEQMKAFADGWTAPKKETTNEDLSRKIDSFADKVVKEFTDVKKELMDMKNKISGVHLEVESLARITQRGFDATAAKTDVARLWGRVDRLDATVSVETRLKMEKMQDEINDLRSDHDQLVGNKKK